VSDAPPIIDEAAPAKDAVPAAAFGIRGQTQFGDIRRRFFRNKLAVLGLAMVGIVFALAAFAPLIAPYDPRAQNLQNTTAKPSFAHHWFGTDELGRDQLSRVIYGSRIAIVVGLASIVLALLLGVILGSIAGYRGGKADSIVMRVADAFFAFPLLIGAILIILVTGRGSCRSSWPSACSPGPCRPDYSARRSCRSGRPSTWRRRAPSAPPAGGS
jgi:ABC-type dipeptide/oligopeptide/nickel transport system permease subunit